MTAARTEATAGRRAGHDQGEQDRPVRPDRGRADGFLTGSRDPSPRRRQSTRSWGLVAVAALMVLGSGLAVAAWGARAGDREEVVMVGGRVSKGQIVERADLVSASVAGAAGTVPIAQIDTVVGQTAAVDLLPGQLVLPSMLTTQVVPASGESSVGLALDGSRVPGSGLQPGDIVDVVAVPPATGGEVDQASLDAPEVLAGGARVYAVDTAGAAAGQVLLTVVVDARDAARIAAYSTQNRVAVVEAAATTVGGTGPGRH